MKKWTMFIIVTLIFVLGGVGIVKLRKKQLESIRIETKLPVPVDTVKVKRGTFKEYRLYLGILKSNKQAVVRARVQGEIGEVLKREGDIVKKGEPVIELDKVNGVSVGTRKSLEKSIKNQIKAISDMEKTVSNLKKIYQRDLNLYQNKAISKQALELSENRVKQAEVQLSAMKNSLENLREKLSFFTVKSPFTGVVSRITVNLGDVVMPSVPLMEIENSNNCKLSVSVSSDDIPLIKRGSEAKILFKDKAIHASVSRVFPSVKDTGIGTVEIYFPSRPFDLPLGSRLSAEIPVKVLDNVLIVPDNAVLTSSGKNLVFKVNTGKVEPVNVAILGASADSYAIEGDLKEGDVLVKGSDSLLMRLEKGTEVITDTGE